MTDPPIYLDYNATTPLAREVADAMRPFLSGLFGNPSSEHRFGAEAKRALEAARRQVAKMVGAAPEEIVFTSGGTEANNLAIRGAVGAGRERRGIVISAVEHPAVVEVARALSSEGFVVRVIPVDGTGSIDLEEAERLISAETAVVSVMLANNEVGTIQNVRAVADLAHACGAIMHTDAAQAIGKIPVDVDDLKADLLSIAGHKFYAPKGVGALYIRSGLQLTKQMHGASHERGLRPGTENVMFAAALGAAAEKTERTLSEDIPRIQALRDRLEETILDRLGRERVQANAATARRLPNTSSLSFRGVAANTLLAEIGDRVAASAGAACHADTVELSAVLSAMGVPEAWAMGTVRLSLGIETTAEEVDVAVDVIAGAVERLSGSAPESAGPHAVGEVRLTQFTHGMGCACKIRPQLLEKVLVDLPVRQDERVLVDTSTSDDAGVFLLSDDVALVQTTDFLTPIVDDPYTFGAIAAANALSDIYAMGATPLYALNIVGFPSQRLDASVLHAILRGAADKCAEAGISVIGGHTVEDTEPKFGLAVTGSVHPDRVLRNSRAKPDHVLVLTKPIGTGIIATGVKRGVAEEGDGKSMEETMLALNQTASEALGGLSVSACTDVTGFGLLGHLLEMVRGSGVVAELKASAVPVLDAAKRLASAGVVPGGTLDNLRYVEPHVQFGAGLSEATKWLLADAQTSGGLLVALDEADAGKLLERLRASGNSRVAVIGRVVARGTPAIRITD